VTGADARDIMEAALRRELVGPADGEEPRGKPLDTTVSLLTFDSWEAARGPWHDAATGEEILTEAEPLRRYGIGVLHPRGRDTEDISGITGLPGDDDVRDASPSDEITAHRHPEPDTDDFDLSGANAFQPSAMAVSFKARLPARSSLQVSARFASYERLAVRIAGAKRDRQWWVRRPHSLSATVSADQMIDQTSKLFALDAVLDAQSHAQPELQAYSRPVPGDPDTDVKLVTLALVNTSIGTGSAAAMLQASFEIRPADGASIEPYPEPATPGGADDEERSIALLYRNKRTYAIGHGCAAGWEEPDGGATSAVRAESLPAYEVSSLTPDIFRELGDGSRVPVQASMNDLAKGSTEGRAQVETILDLYASWIDDRAVEMAGLEPHYRAAAARHLELCRGALTRMRAGWALATSDPLASRAFRLANEAMLYQQIRSKLPLRDVRLSKDGILEVTAPAPEVRAGSGTGFWRPFQIAFLLASLPEIVDARAPDRELVDLIFFPTGGGKTEAYLGAAAVSMLARRLRDSGDVGTDVLMRYTLRLLTAQQFLRAASLLCVMEDIRDREPDLGEARFSIGIWLGGATTPNTWKSAKAALARLRNDSRAENPFLLLRCPWCGARMGPVPKSGRGQEAVGYVLVGSGVRFRCPDRACRYSGTRGLPVHVVDEDIYATRPTLVIGTVDKFAMLAWRPEARQLFGLDARGDRDVSPPGLIIQDELHLISGPLGSMVGLYEPVIEDLCTDHRAEPAVRPKIIASTATIRRYEKQVRDLYGRARVALFPPHGLEEGHSFFAEPAVSTDGSPARGRRYLGVMSASLGSTQTVQVRVAASTLQAATEIPDTDRDGYWTNLNFLNSLRELGNTVSLLQSDIPDYLTGLRNRDALLPADTRWPRTVLELTSRRRSDEIPKAIEQLQKRCGENGCVDICLASSIIEVGVDIDRLSLMTIVGQPKTTAQYIQVSGRVGRSWWERPGLVITIYGAAKPRDRSHYERFRSYHQRLYAQVEPTSLTPFALPVLQRGLHGAVVTQVRQSGPEDLGVWPFPENRFGSAVDLIRTRAQQSDPAELPAFETVERRRAREWRQWERTSWDANAVRGDPLQGLMRYAGSSPEPGGRAPIWDVPTSMRSVDAECRLHITSAYALDAASEPESGG
jgi:Helicase conserved C-terminal domain